MSSCTAPHCLQRINFLFVAMAILCSSNFENLYYLYYTYIHNAISLNVSDIIKLIIFVIHDVTALMDAKRLHNLFSYVIIDYEGRGTMSTLFKCFSARCLPTPTNQAHHHRHRPDRCKGTSTVLHYNCFIIVQAVYRHHIVFSFVC